MKYQNSKNRFNLSKYTKNWSNGLNLDLKLYEIDDLCAGERYDLYCDLNSIVLGKLPRFFLGKINHLNNLSINTILESQFVDSLLVRKLLMEAGKEWINSNPFQVSFSGNASKINVNFVPPKRTKKTDLNLEVCKKEFMNEMFDFLTEFCQILNSEEFFYHLIEEYSDMTVKERLQKFSYTINKTYEQICKELKRYSRSSLKRLKRLNCSHIPKDSKRNSKQRSASVEHELNEILKAQFGDFKMENEFELDNIKNNNHSQIEANDIINAQFLDMSPNNLEEFKFDDKNMKNANDKLEYEYDKFSEQLNNIFVESSEKVLDVSKDLTETSNIENLTTNSFDNFIDNTNKCNNSLEVHFNKESLDYEMGQISMYKHLDAYIKKDETIKGIKSPKMKLQMRSIRKKNLEKDDHQDLQKKGKKRKKEDKDKKHKQKKSKRNKNKDSDYKFKIETVNDKTENNSVIKEESDLKDLFFNENDLFLKKTFKPKEILYYNAYKSSGFDLYQDCSYPTTLTCNFREDFDATLPVDILHNSPLINLFLNSAGNMDQFIGILPDVKTLNFNQISLQNAFLWALTLATLEPVISDEQVCNKTEEEHFSSLTKKSYAKPSNNPLMQAFRQVVEANKKKEEGKKTSNLSSVFNVHPILDGKKSNFKSGMFVLKSPIISSIYRLNSMLKETSKNNIREALENFKFNLKNCFDEMKICINNKDIILTNTSLDIDFSIISTHLEKLSNSALDLYHEAEIILAIREKKKIARELDAKINRSQNIVNSLEDICLPAEPSKNLKLSITENISKSADDQNVYKDDHSNEKTDIDEHLAINYLKDAKSISLENKTNVTHSTGNIINNETNNISIGITKSFSTVNALNNSETYAFKPSLLEVDIKSIKSVSEKIISPLKTTDSLNRSTSVTKSISLTNSSLTKTETTITFVSISPFTATVSKPIISPSQIVITPKPPTSTTAFSASILAMLQAPPRLTLSSSIISAPASLSQFPSTTITNAFPAFPCPFVSLPASMAYPQWSSYPPSMHQQSLQVGQTPFMLPTSKIIANPTSQSNPYPGSLPPNFYPNQINNPPPQLLIRNERPLAPFPSLPPMEMFKNLPPPLPVPKPVIGNFGLGLSSAPPNTKPTLLGGSNAFISEQEKKCEHSPANSAGLINHSWKGMQQLAKAKNEQPTNLTNSVASTNIVNNNLNKIIISKNTNSASSKINASETSIKNKNSQSNGNEVFINSGIINNSGITEGGQMLGVDGPKKPKIQGRVPKESRIFVFNRDLPICQSVEQFLEGNSMKKFDPHNFILLRHLPYTFECLVLVHKADLNCLQKMPNLLKLKRDLRVVFVTYVKLEDVKEKMYKVIFPRAGMVLIDETALLACKSEVMDGLCQFMKKQTIEKGTPWKLMITSNTFKALEVLSNQLEDEIEEYVRLTEMSQILATYKSSGIVELVPDYLFGGYPKAISQYHTCFVQLQMERINSCRHFLFVTDMARNHPAAKMFLTNGIDIMNLVEFMRCFVSKLVVHVPKQFPPFMSQMIPNQYIDANLSDGIQTINI